MYTLELDDNLKQMKEAPPFLFEVSLQQILDHDLHKTESCPSCTGFTSFLFLQIVITYF